MNEKVSKRMCMKREEERKEWIDREVEDERAEIYKYFVKDENSYFQILFNNCCCINQVI